MDASAFNRAVRAFATGRTRRHLLGLLGTLPLQGWLSAQPEESVEAAGRCRRRKKQHHHQQGNDKGHRKGKQKAKGKGNAGRQDTCLPEPVTVTCAGTCSNVANNCGEAVDCGSCACTPACPLCQTCDATTRLCGAVPDGTTCNDGNSCSRTDTCQGGVCVGSNPVLCPPQVDPCHDTGTCDPATGTCTNPAKPNGTACTSVPCGECDGSGACVTVGTSCVAGGSAICCGADRTCCDGGMVPVCCDKATQDCLSNGTCAIR